jgi:arylsulfatase
MPMIGRSMMPILSGEQETIREEEGVGYELFEMKAYIRGNWKILRLPAPFGSGAWALYDLATDPGEMNDLSEDYPEIKEELIAAWQQYAEANEVFDHKGRFDALYRKVYGAQQ